MSGITLPAYAKINLSLDVLRKQPDGYHQVKMVMHQIALHDLVTVDWQPGSSFSVQLACEGSDLPLDQENIAYRAALRMREKYGGDQNGHLAISLEKHIPVAAGLAGGSADGAAVILALHQLWKLDASLSQLMEVGKELGADIPFCLMGQAAAGRSKLSLEGAQQASVCALAEGIGEALTPLPPLPIAVLLSKPSIGVSTAAVYGGLQLDSIRHRPDTEQLICGIKEHNLFKVTSNMINLLETVTLVRFPVVAQQKAAMENLRLAAAVLMSGSGPTIFGLFTNPKKARRAYTYLKAGNPQTWLTKTLDMDFNPY